MNAPLFPLLNTGSPVLVLSDVTSGVSRSLTEAAMGRGMSHSVKTGIGQVVGSQVGRLLSQTDDYIPVSYLQQDPPILKSVYTGATTGAIDWTMGRNAGWKRFVVPTLTDYASGKITDMALGGNPDVWIL